MDGVDQFADRDPFVAIAVERFAVIERRDAECDARAALQLGDRRDAGGLAIADAGRWCRDRLSSGFRTG